MEFLQIVILGIVSFLVLFVIAKVLGYRQIAQLSFFDYIVGISIGSIAAEMSTNIDLEWWKGITAMAIYGALDVVLDLVSQKSIKARSVIDGNPIVLVSKGKIIRSNVKKAKIQIDDLLCAARVAGYFNLTDIDYAIMETTGDISFLPVPLQRNLNPKDFNFAPVRSGLCTSLILDGRLLSDGLNKAGISEAELKRALTAKNLEIKDVLLATIDETGKIDIFENK